MDSLNDLTAAEIRAALARSRKSVVWLARELGWSQTYAARRADGRAAISMDDLEKIATALEIPVARLLPSEAREVQPKTSIGKVAVAERMNGAKATLPVRAIDSHAISRSAKEVATLTADRRRRVSRLAVNGE